MGHLYHGYVTNYQRVFTGELHQQIDPKPELFLLGLRGNAKGLELKPSCNIRLALELEA